MSSIEDFVKDKAEAIGESDIEQALENEDGIVAKLRGPLEKFTHQVRLFLDMIGDYHKDRYCEAPKHAICAIVFVVLYILMPFDLMPDMIPGVGLIDDALVVAAAWRMFCTDIERYEAWREKSQELIAEDEE